MNDNPFMKLAQDDAAIAASAPAEPTNPFMEIAAQDRQVQDAQQQSTLDKAMKMLPDRAASVQTLSKETGFTPDFVERNFDEVKRRTESRKVQSLVSGSPVLARQFSDPQFAALAHDDVERLSALDYVLSPAKNTAKALYKGLSEGAANTLYGGAATLFGVGGRALDAPLQAVFGGNPLLGVEQGYLAEQNKVQQVNQRLGVPATGFVGDIFGGVQSVGQMLPAVVSALGGNPGAALGMIGAATGGQAYGQARDAGLDPFNAAAFAGGQAAVEIATERIPFSRLLNDIKLGSPLHKILMRQLAAEIPGEQIATVLQDANEWAVLNPEKPFSQYLAERPSAAASTLISTITAVSIMGGAGHVAGRIANRGQQNQAQAEQAEAAATQFEQINEIAQASALLKRSPESFERFVEQATEDGPVQDVYIDANTLMQSGLAEQVAQVSPSVQEQLQAAVQTGSAIRIPVSEYATNIAATEFAQPLLDHLKTDPEGMSRIEAQEYMQSAQEQIQQDLERTLRDQNADDAFVNSVNAVQQNIRAQLETTNRFTPQVNEAYSALQGAWYGQQAARLGITPEELYQRYPLRVQAEAIAGGQQFEQKGRLDALRQQWADEGIDAAVSEKDGIITLSKIVVPEGNRDTGQGTKAMQELIDYADRTGQHVALSPSADFGGNKKRLVDFYKRFGFVENKGKNRAFKTSESMYRQAPGKILEQRARGAFNPETNTISLLKSADLSTFLHESGHFFLESQLDIAAQLSREMAESGQSTLTESQQQILDDANALLKWFGVSDLPTWYNLDFEEKRSYHEKFARGFEAYLFEGKSPSIEIQSIFRRFSTWLKNIYRQLQNLNVELKPEVRSVMDRMLATDAQIQAAEYGRSMMPLFESAEQASMSPQQFADYQALGREATEQAQAELNERSLRDMKWLQNARSRALKRLQSQADQLRKQERIEARRDILTQPVYRAWQFLTGKRDAENPAAAARLSRSALREFYGDDTDAVWKSLDARKMVTNDGLPPDAVADLLLSEDGQPLFDSGDALVRALAEATPLNEAIESLTDQRMLERHGDVATPEALQRGADAAVHNQMRARVLAAELQALTAATEPREAAGTDRRGRQRTVDVIPQAAREYARTLIAGTKIRNLKPGQFTGAETRAARAAEKALRAGDLALAAAEKRNQMVNHYTARETYNAQDEVNAGVRYLSKFQNEGTRKNLDVDYLEQIDALLEKFDLRTGQSLKAIDRRRSLIDWVEAQQKMGFEPDIDAAMLETAAKVHYKELTMDEFRGVLDSIKEIEHTGRLKKKLLLSKDRREFEAVRDELAQTIAQFAPDRVIDPRTPATRGEKFLEKIKSFGAAHIKIATWARIMDGSKDGGAFWNLIVRTANERQNMKSTMIAQATERLHEIMAPVLKQGSLQKKQHFPAINKSLTREQVFAVGLNVGNEGNLQRVLDGEGWNQYQLSSVLESLTQEDWRAIQDIWDHFETYVPQIAAKERRLYGKEPQWIRAIPVNTKYGTFRGGYYPLKYDPAATIQAERHADAEAAKRQMEGGYNRATTRRSFVKTRSEEIKGRPLLFSMSGVYSGVSDVIHDLAWHEWLIDTNRLMNDGAVDRGIRTRYGPIVKQNIKSWINDIAAGDTGTTNAIDNATALIRQGVSASALGFSVWTAVQQPIGLTQSVVRVGGSWIGKSAAQYMSAPARLTREVQAQSEFMRNRTRTRFRELNELANVVEGQSGFRQFTSRYAYWLMMKFQTVVDTITWQGQYEKAISEGYGDADAIALSDQAVIDSQGGGEVKDLSAIERGGPTQKLFTVFYSFFNTQLNLAVANQKSPASIARKATNYLLLYTIPAALYVGLKAGLTPGEDDDSFMQKLAKEHLGALLGNWVMVRELQGVADALTGSQMFGYSGPAGLRVLPEGEKLVKQISQGELDGPLAKAFINTVGSLFGLPTAQINRSIKGATAISEGKTSNPAAVIFGYEGRL